jgi:hypothetical protein
VIVTGIAWIRTTHVELADGRCEDSVWAVAFGGDGPEARKAPRDDATIERGPIADLAWDPHWREPLEGWRVGA